MSDKNQSQSGIRSVILPCMGILVVVLLSAGCIGASSGTPDSVTTTPVSPPDVPNQAHQVTMQVVMVDEDAHAEYATVWLTPSARIYTLAKNSPDYETSIGLMEQSRKDGSFLTFTLDTQDSSQGFSIIKSVVKGVQPTYSSNGEKAVQVAQPVSPPDGVNQDSTIRP